MEAECNVTKGSVRRWCKRLVAVQKLPWRATGCCHQSLHAVDWVSRLRTSESSWDNPSCVRSLEAIMWNLVLDGNLNLFCLRMGALPVWLKRTTTLSSSRIG